MNYDGSRTVHPLGYGVDDHKVVKAMMKEGQRGSKPCWTSTNDEDGGSIGKRHDDANGVNGGA